MGPCRIRYMRKMSTRSLTLPLCFRDLALTRSLAFRASTFSKLALAISSLLCSTSLSCARLTCPATTCCQMGTTAAVGLYAYYKHWASCDPSSPWICRRTRCVCVCGQGRGLGGGGAPPFLFGFGDARNSLHRCQGLRDSSSFGAATKNTSEIVDSDRSLTFFGSRCTEYIPQGVRNCI
jgi:hypothetical protein